MTAIKNNNQQSTEAAAATATETAPTRTIKM
jgi:hypothetical protein